ncbi:hypothetical protein [Neptunicoccus cionae]|uniref:Uncharacterized protein n=1 Tax=Neptunicoccus cionae TaxID=2035344 RepID=A0A916QSV8_9RHOB|nr:hypothetical protein [Amylibacter cionae]GGA07537.1 hypothetical protein GCM10011498_04250 [Amylibacter cionae]
MSDNVIDAAEAEIDTLVSGTYRIHRGSLRNKLRRVGRRLPRSVAEDVAYLDEARRRTAHPRRRGQIDAKRVDAIVHNQRKALGRVDVARDKARERINWLGVLVMNLMLFGVVYYALLKWLGAI